MKMKIHVNYEDCINGDYMATAAQCVKMLEIAGYETKIIDLGGKAEIEYWD